MSQNIYLPVGLPASGKSTWAIENAKQKYNTVRVCRDDLRFMLGFGWTFVKENEKWVKETRDRLIDEALKTGKNVIVDEMNLGDKNLNYFRQKYPNVEVHQVLFTDVDVNECIRRDALRGERSVGKKKILELWRKFIEPKYVEPNYHSKQNCFCVDLDGTWAIIGDRNPYNRDFYNDTVCQPVNKMVHNMIYTVDKIFIVSGRKSSFYDETKKWLIDKCGISDFYFGDLFEKDKKFTLLMRNDDDHRGDDLVKQDFYNRIIKDYNIVFVIDDRKKVKRMWNKNNVFVFDVNQYDIDY